MASVKKIFGVPRQDPEEQKEHEVVKTPEFDLTQFAKALVPLIALILGGVIAALRAAKVKEVTDPAVLVGVLGVVAAAVLGMALVAAVDIAVRAFLSGEGSAHKKESSTSGDVKPEEVAAAPKGMQVWLEGGGPYPVLAMSGAGESAKYLVATGSTQERSVGETKVKALDGSVEWCDADKVRAMRSDKWP